jgi:aryl-alcohol dehydrogenase-like predicted oxidoreductase
MRYRTLGTSGLRVSELILGAMTFGEQGEFSLGSPHDFINEIAPGVFGKALTGPRAQ